MIIIPIVAGALAVAAFARRPSGRSGSSIADRASTDEGQQNRNRMKPSRGFAAQRRDPCLAYIDGKPMFLLWKSAGQVKPFALGPMKVFEQNGQMVHVGSPPNQGGFGPDGYDGWIRRCPELDTQAFLRPPARGIRRTSPSRSRAMKATRNCAGGMGGAGGCTPGEFAGFGIHAVRVGGPIDMSVATPAGSASFRRFGPNFVRIDEQLIPNRNFIGRTMRGIRTAR